MVGCRSSRLNQNKPFSGPVLTLMSSSAEFCSFSLSVRLCAIGLNALTRLSTVIYINCAVKSLYMLRQLDIDNLINKQFLISVTFWLLSPPEINIKTKTIYSGCVYQRCWLI